MSRVWPRGTIYSLEPEPPSAREAYLEKADIAFIESLSFEERQKLARSRSGVATIGSVGAEPLQLPTAARRG